MAYAQPLRSFSVLQRETAALIAPQIVGSGLSLILYGVYIVLQYHYAKSDLYRRLSWPVEATLVLVCFLVTAYEIVQYADTMYWAITVKRTPDDIFTGVPLDSYFNDTIDSILPFTYNDAGFNANTDPLLRKLIKSALRTAATAAYTAILAVGGAAVASATPDTDYTSTFAHFAFWFPLPPCYALSLFTTLSARRTIDAQLAPPSESPASPRRKVAPPATASVKQQRATIDYKWVASAPSGMPRRRVRRRKRRRRRRRREGRRRWDGTDESTKREKEETVTRWREEQKKWTLSLEKAAAPHGDEEDDELEEWGRHGRSRRGVV